MSRWFRMYDDVLNNPKVQRLSGDDFKGWVNILCLASSADGSLPPIADIAFALRMDAKRAAAMIGRLTSADLIKADGERFTPHDWSALQYKSDVSTDRVKRFRQRSKKQDETAPETAPDTETDTDSSVAKATGTVVPLVDPEKVLFDSGLRYLGECGISEAKARPLIGKWKRDHGSGQVIEALAAAQRQGVFEPIGWIEARWKTAVNGGYGPGHSGVPL